LHQLAYRIRNTREVTRLGKKAATFWKVLFGHPGFARGRDYFDWRAAVADSMSKPETVQRTRHINVGENDAYVVSAFEDCYRFVRARSLNDSIARVLYRLNGYKSDKKLIFDHEHRSRF
jgi:hypothetical protein